MRLQWPGPPKSLKASDFVFHRLAKKNYIRVLKQWGGSGVFLSYLVRLLTNWGSEKQVAGKEEQYLGAARPSMRKWSQRGIEGSGLSSALVSTIVTRASPTPRALGQEGASPLSHSQSENTAIQRVGKNHLSQKPEPDPTTASSNAPTQVRPG